MKKRLVAIILAATMIAGTGLTASAEPISDMAGAGSGQEVTGDATLNLPEIKITVPTTADIVINPFQMDYKAPDAAEDAAPEKKQIICVPQDIINESNVAVAVNVADLTATDVADGVTVSTTAITSKVTTKSAFLYLEVVEKGAEGAKFAEAYDAKSTSQVVIPDASGEGTKVKKASKDAIVTLGAGNETETVASFTIGGAVVANPTKTNEDKSVSADPWVSTDTLSVSFKFTFTPQINE